MIYLRDTAVARVRNELLARHLAEQVADLAAVLEVAQEGREVVQAAEGQAVPAGVLSIGKMKIHCADVCSVSHCYYFLSAGEAVRS